MSGGDTTQSGYGQGRARYALGALFVVLMFSLVDRNILSILLVDIQEEFGATDREMGFLTGTAFAVSNALAGIPLARLADRATRRNIVAGGLAFWSALTAGQGFASSFAILAAARVGVGIGEASTGPAAHSMISDLFRPQWRATAISIYTMGGHFGVLIGLVAAGWISEELGWRMTLVVVGLPGLLVAALVAGTLREPLRGQVDQVADEPQPPLLEVVRYLWSRPTFRHLVAAAPLLVAAFYCVNIWGPAFLIRVHDLSKAEVGMRLGPVVGIGGAIGTLLGGYLSDRLGARDPRDRLRVPAYASLGMIPFLVGFLSVEDVDLAVLLLFPMMVLAGFFIGPIYSVALGIARLRMRAMSSALVHLLTSIVGAGLAPQLVGISNDLLSERFGDEAVRVSLYLLCFTSAWGATHALLAARSLPQDMEEATR